MTTAETTAASGAVLGAVVVLLAQQLGALPLSEVWPGFLWLFLGALVGGLVFGTVGWLADRH